MTFSIIRPISSNVSNINRCYRGVGVKYTKDPMIPPTEPAELCSAIPTARFVGEPRMLFEFHAIEIAMPENAPIATIKVPM